MFLETVVFAFFKKAVRDRVCLLLRSPFRKNIRTLLLQALDPDITTTKLPPPKSMQKGSKKKGSAPIWPTSLIDIRSHLEEF